MRGKAGTLAAAAVLVAGFAVPAAVGAASVLKSRMTGAQIVNDDGGAPRGVAQATLRLNDARSRVCFEIEYSGLGGKATAGYVRHGRPGHTARPEIVLFSGRSASPVTGCVGAVGKRTLAGLSEHPGGYSVDLATAKRPKGAVRGQLRGADEQQLEGPPSGGIG
jgi:hypothetical protein